MARATKLKVFRTPIGFHDAYVAAPSQKAALKAWGSDTNLFAAGSAERVDDPALTREPLASPGEVIRRLRGTLAEHVAALPKDEPCRAIRPERSELPNSREDAAPPPPKPRREPKPPRPPKPKPRPDRAPLDRAEAALVETEKSQAAAKAELARRQDELDRERRALEAKHDRESETLQRRVDAARDKYGREMRAWRAD